jgi:hypothetical protein
MNAKNIFVTFKKANILRKYVQLVTNIEKNNSGFKVKLKIN